jgi:hypothetical protein
MEYTEGYPYLGMFVKSPLDGQVYCRKNGEFFRHLVENGIPSYSNLIERLHPEKVQTCKCGKIASFRQASMTYLSCCGSPECTMDARREGLRNRTDEEKQKHIIAIREAIANIPPEVQQEQRRKRVEVGQQRGSYKNSVQKREATCVALYGDPKYNNREKISETKQNWTPEQRQSFLTNLKAAFGGGWMNDFTTEETWAKRRKRLEQLGKLIPIEMWSEWQLYNRQTRRLTERVYKQHRELVNPNNYPRKTGGDGYHLDHIIPVAYGFVNNIPPEEIAKAENLQMLPWRANMSKGKKYVPTNT